MTVGELAASLDNRHEETLTAELGSIQFADDATSLTAQDGRVLTLDESAEAALARYLKIPRSYLQSLQPGFKAETYRYHADQHSEVSTVLEVVGGHLISVHSPDQMMLPVRSVAELATKVFRESDTVRTLVRDHNLLQLDITTADHAVEVPNPNRIIGRPEVGDITEGGVRILAYPYQVKAPSGVSYFNRLECTNGMCQEIKSGEIRITASTVDEVLEQMEAAAREVLSSLDDKLQSYLHTAHTPVPGSRQAFALQLGREARLGAGVMFEVMDVINQLPDEGTSVYDVMQAFTGVANNDVTHQTMLRLQTLGGSLAMNTQRMIDRCGVCERLLPS